MDPPASTSQALKSQAYTTMHGLFSKRDQTQDLGHFRQSLYHLRYISSPRLTSLVPDLLPMPDHRLQVGLQAARNQITLDSPCIYWLSSPPPPPVYKTLPHSTSVMTAHYPVPEALTDLMMLATGLFVLGTKINGLFSLAAFLFNTVF